MHGERAQRRQTISGAHTDDIAELQRPIRRQQVEIDRLRMANEFLEIASASLAAKQQNRKGLS